MTVLNLPLSYDTDSGLIVDATGKTLLEVVSHDAAAAIVERCNEFDSTMRSIHNLLMSITAHTDPLGIIIKLRQIEQAALKQGESRG